MTTDWKALCKELVEAWDSYSYADAGDATDRMTGAANEARAAVAQPEPEGLPPGYIDAEHAGCDRKMLEAFYKACRSEGGTADEIHLRGLRAVLALAQPGPEGLKDDELCQILHQAICDFPPTHPDALNLDARQYEIALELHKARAVLARYAHPTPQPIPVSERLPEAVNDAFAIVQERLDQLAGDQELMIYRGSDGQWSIDHTNPSPHVQLGEVSGEYTSFGLTLGDAVCKLAALLPLPQKPEPPQ